MFKLQKEKFGKFIKLKLINQETKEFVVIIPEFGANVNELVLNKNKNYSIIDGFSNYQELIKKKSFRGAKLIPFPNRINNGEYTFNNKKYILPINFPKQKHAIHGFVHNKKFIIKNTSKNKSSISVDLVYNYKKELVGYPFAFEVIIKYTLTKKGFTCTTVIKNKSEEKIPIGDGWHPYFKLNRKVDDLYVKIPSKNRIIVDSRMIPTGKSQFIKFNKFSKIGNQKFDTGFVVDKKGIASTELCDSSKKIKIVVWQETGNMKYNYLQIFIPSTRKSIAIEPMTCNTDAFNNKEGLIILKPKQIFKASYGVYLE